MDYEQELAFISARIKEVYREAASSAAFNIYNKAYYDEVTNIDLTVEKRLIDIIKAHDGDARFLSEEYNSAALKRGRTWIIDPIDGTCNLTHGIPTYAVQCALFDQGEIKLSAIYFPFNDELFTACRDGGARLNGNLIKGVSRPVNRALVSFGDFVHTNQGLFDLEHQIMQHVAGIVERIRMYGAASIDFAYAACGRLDGSYTFVKNPWDILPGIFLCREAGLQVCDAYGEPYTEASDTVAVFSTPELMEACTSPLRGRANCPESHSTNSSTVGAAPA